MRGACIGLVCGILITAFSYAPVWAHVPILVEAPHQHDVLYVDDPIQSTARYGTLLGHPHLFEFRVEVPTRLFVETLVPQNASTTVSAIVLEVLEEGGVREVARLRARDASWDRFFEPFGGDAYLRGRSFDQEITPGLYRIEVSTPDNRARYVLGIGYEERWGDVGYFELLGRLMDVKEFMGKSRIRIVESPFVYVPLLLVSVGVGLVWWYVRRRRVRMLD